MIAPLRGTLLFELPGGESIPCSADMITVDIIGPARAFHDAEMLRHAAASVFHYFKNELDRECVTLQEFSAALQRVLGHLGYVVCESEPPHAMREADLGLLLQESGTNAELLFFPRLRDELRLQLGQSPRVVRFYGLRACVKQLAGARRWSHRCEQLQDQIVAYLRECFSADAGRKQCSLVVE